MIKSYTSCIKPLSVRIYTYNIYTLPSIDTIIYTNRDGHAFFKKIKPETTVLLNKRVNNCVYSRYTQLHNNIMTHYALEFKIVNNNNIHTHTQKLSVTTL